MTPVNPIPDGYRTLTPYLAVRDGAVAIEFYRRGLGAEVIDRMDAPGGGTMRSCRCRTPSPVIGTAS